VSTPAAKLSPSGWPTSCDVSDACDRLEISAVRTGALRPMWPGCPPATGRVTTWRMVDARTDAAPLPDQLAALATADADVLLVDVAGPADMQCWGAVLAIAARHWGIGAVLVNGAVRDVQELAALSYPTYARGVHPARAKGRLRVAATGVDVHLGGAAVHEGATVVIDASGAVFFPATHVERVLAVARAHADDERRMLDRVLAGEDPRAVFLGESRNRGVR